MDPQAGLARQHRRNPGRGSQVGEDAIRRCAMRQRSIHQRPVCVSEHDRATEWSALPSHLALAQSGLPLASVANVTPRRRGSSPETRHCPTGACRAFVAVPSREIPSWLSNHER
jgi:hypothetical protein